MHTSLTYSVSAAIVLGACALLSGACGSSHQSASHSDSTATVSLTPTGPCHDDTDHPIVFVGGATCADGTAMPKAIVPGGGNSWSPSGARDAYVTNDATTLAVRDHRGVDETLFRAPHGVTLVHRTAWSPDGALVAVLLLDERGFDDGIVIGTSLPSYRPSLALIDSDTGKLRRRIRLSPAIVNMPYITNPPDTLAFSPDGSQVLVSWDSPAVVDTQTGHVQTLWRTPAVATWSPDGHVIFLDVVNRRRFGALRSWSANDGTRVIWTGPQLANKGIVAEHGIEYGQLRVSPDGTQLAIRTVSQDRTGIAIIPWSGTEPGMAVTIDTVRGWVWDFDWSPEGTRIAAVVVQGSVGSVQLLDLTNGRWSKIGSLPFTIDGPDTLEAVAPIKKISWNG